LCALLKNTRATSTSSLLYCLVRPAKGFVLPQQLVPPRGLCRCGIPIITIILSLYIYIYVFAYLYSCYLLRACTVYHRIGSTIYCCSIVTNTSRSITRTGCACAEEGVTRKLPVPRHQDDTIEPIERDDVLGVSLGRLKNVKNYAYTRARRVCVCELGTLNIYSTYE